MSESVIITFIVCATIVIISLFGKGRGEKK